MKKLLLILSFASLTIIANAQHYYTLPDSNVQWENTWSSIGSYGNDFYSTDNINRDTIINTVTYTKLYNSSHVYQGGYNSDTTGKMFYISPDSIHANLVMDLSKNAGDSVKNILIFVSESSFGYVDLYVDSVDYPHAGPYTLKRLYLSNKTLFPFTTGKLFWIEKIGTSDVFKNYICNDNPEIDEGMYCMQYSDTIYYQSFVNNLCYIYGNCATSADIDNSLRHSKINIFPNPTNDKLTIENIQQKTLFSLLSLQGQLLIEHSIEEGKTEMDISELAKGVYILRLCSNDKTEVTKIVKE